MNSTLRTCHVCRYKFRWLGTCDYCGHLTCENCGLGDTEGDCICSKCQHSPKHRRLRPPVPAQAVAPR